MALTVAKLIVMNNSEYNGHKQLDIEGYTFTLKEALELCDQITEELHEQEDYRGSCYLQIHSDGGASIHADNYWKQGEHSLGHRDKLMASISVEVEKSYE